MDCVPDVPASEPNKALSTVKVFVEIPVTLINSYSSAWSSVAFVPSCIKSPTLKKSPSLTSISVSVPSTASPRFTVLSTYSLALLIADGKTSVIEVALQAETPASAS